MKKSLLLFLLGFFCSPYLFAQTKTWAGTTADWHTPENWDPVGVPTASDDVVINTATTNPIISSNVSAKSINISVAGALLTVNSGVTLTISNNAGPVLQISNGGLTNNGTVLVTNTNATEVSQEAAILLTFSAIINNAGTITVNGGANYGIRMAAATINNQSGGVITSNGKEVIRFGDTNAILNNNAGATFNGSSPSPNSALTLIPGKLNNYGLINTTGGIELYYSNSRLRNLGCGIIKMVGDYYTQTSATTENDGLLQIDGTLNNAGTTTNNGVIRASAYPTLTNRRLLINNNAANNAIFTPYTNSYLSAIQGIFMDAAATISAGTYTSNNNTFIPGNFAGGTYTLYAKISYGSCTFIVPFSYIRAPTRRYVKTTATGTGDGSSWANASSDIQAMINASSVNDSVWVATGIYKPLADASGNTSPSNIRNKIWYMKSGVKLFGGFAGTETSFTQRDFKTNKTIFSGDVDNNDTNTDGNSIAETYTDIQGENVYHILAIINCDKNTGVDGIIFTAGNSTGSTVSQTVSGFPLSSVYGASLSINASFPSIKNCIFIGNDGKFGSTYHNNTNGTDTLRISNSYYLNNRGEQTGGMFIHRGHTFVDNVVLFNNAAFNVNNYRDGGAICISSNMQAGKTIKFTNLTVVSSNSLTSKKTVTVDGDGNISFINSIIWNETPVTGGNIFNALDNGTLTSSYSILQNSGAGGTWNGGYGTDGGNNYDGDPLFTNISDLDGADNKFFTTDDGLSLTGCSPGVNTGTNTSIFSTDITNSPRPFNGGISDMGAYERQSAPTLTTNPTDVAVNKTVVCPGNTVTLSAQCSAGNVTWYNQATGGTAIGTGNSLNQSPTNNIVYYSACEAGNCKSERVATAEITISTVSSNISLTASISGTVIYASSNTITATNKVLSTANAQYLANNSISLNAGFEASPGAVFVAKATPISACN
ncbi:3-coathanger stack domain-containing protein [Emticicia fontis]